MPSTCGYATTLWKVARGDVTMPINLEKTFIGAGVDPDATEVLAIFSFWEVALSGHSLPGDE
jgi:hypothetical protein